MKHRRVAYDQGIEAAVDRLQDELDSPLLYVPFRWHVFGRTEDGERPKFLRTHHDLHIFIDPIDGTRITVPHEDWDPREWEEFLEQAKHIPVESTVSEKQLSLILDTSHRVIFAGGGQRGGKTEAAAMWLARQWGIKGRAGAEAFWVAPEQDLTQIGVKKLVSGGDDKPGILPPELVRFYPERASSKPRQIELIDDSVISLRYASEKVPTRNLKGHGPYAIAGDEVCEITPVQSWRVLRGRVNERRGHKGQIFFSSTPMPGHWAESEIVLPVKAGRKPTYRADHLSMADNPWVPNSEVQEAIDDAGGPEDPVCQREVFGLFVPDGQVLWYAFKAEEHIRPFQSLADLGLVDKTPDVVLRHWDRTRVSPDFAAGQDFNLWPMSTLIGKVGLPKGMPDTPENYWLVCWDEVITKNAGSEMHGHMLLQRKYLPLPIACDPSGAQLGHRLDGKRGVNESSTEAEDLAKAGHDVRACHYSHRGEPVSPPQIDSLKLVHKLMSHGRFVAHTRCRELFKSLTQQQATARGSIYKKPGSSSDKMSSITDAMRYLAWMVFSQELIEDQARPSH